MFFIKCYAKLTLLLFLYDLGLVFFPDFSEKFFIMVFSNVRLNYVNNGRQFLILNYCQRMPDLIWERSLI